jgi:hypothetical protein
MRHLGGGQVLHRNQELSIFGGVSPKNIYQPHIGKGQHEFRAARYIGCMNSAKHWPTWSVFLSLYINQGEGK